jgi:hypothetical protein
MRITKVAAPTSTAAGFAVVEAKFAGAFR